MKCQLTLATLIASLFALSAPFARAESPDDVGPWYAAFAMEHTNPTKSGDMTMAITYSRRATKEEAKQEALKDCRKASSNPDACEIIDTYNTGCEYVAIGKTPYGTSGYAYGLTPQKAYDNCHAKELNCEKLTYGGCANEKYDLPRDQVVEAPRVRYYVALAFGEAYTGTQGFSAVSFGSGRNEAAASAKAVQTCKAKSAYVSECKVITTFNRGCGYIAYGSVNDPKVDMGYGTGKTSQEAYDRCTGAGYRCNTNTIGTCIE